jgi:hypothetical protein
VSCRHRVTVRIDDSPLLILAVHLLVIIAKLVRPGGVRTVMAESLLLKQQLLISSRARGRAPNLKPRTFLRFHEAPKKRKYRRLFS